MVIANNLAAMNAQGQFKTVGSSKKKSTEKLSSGYRINRAADDAAGLTISEKMRSMIRGLNQGSENTQDGISWIQVADGAMAEVHDMLHRLKELSVYAANGTLTGEDRAALDSEAQGILDEIHRIDMSTEFNTNDVFLHGDVMFNVTGEPGELEVYDAVIDENGTTFGGFIFHGERITFDQLTPPGAVRMENGKQVFCGTDGKSTGTYTYKNDATGEFFTLEVVDGAEVPDAKRRIDVNATTNGIEIDGHLIKWSDIKYEDGSPVDIDNPKAGTYSVSYGNSVLDITVDNKCSLRNAQEFIDAINKHNKLEENGGVSYSWITELDGVYTRNAIDPNGDAVFTDGLISADNKVKRNVDNIMAYDSNTDVYDGNLSNGKMEYKLVAEIVKTTENTRIHNDLANGTKAATMNGMDVANQDIKLYLVGADGNKIAGSEVLMSQLSPNKVTDWAKGTQLSDGDSCGDHGWSYDSSDDYCDKIFTYSDPSGKTDIKMEFRLSEVASADSIAYNVELISTGRIQDYDKGLNGTTYSQDFKSSFTDIMTVNDIKKKINLISDGKTDYDATYDSNIALGRDFNKANENLAIINGIDTTQEGKIVYDATNHSISFSVKGNTIDKSSSDYAASRANNTVNYFEFNAYTGDEEKSFVNNIVSMTETIVADKIKAVLSGKTDILTTLPNANQTITLYDNSVFNATLDKAGRRYIYEYDYSELKKTLNAGTANSNNAGQRITIKMSDDSVVYSGEMLESDLSNKYLKLTKDYGSSAKDSYIDANEFVSTINNTITNINNHLGNETYVFNALDPNLKDIVLNEYDKSVSGQPDNITKPIRDYIATNWENIKNSIAKNGKISLDGIADKLKENVVSEYTDGKLKTIEAYYGITLVNGQVNKNNASNISQIAKKVTDDAKKYVSQAMQDIVDASTFTLSTNGYATAKMNTDWDLGEVAYARYDSDLEIEFNGSFIIQHSNINDDYTTIQQFCLNTAVMGITNVDLQTEEKARKSMDKIDKALNYVSSKRSDLGAMQNRLVHTYNNNNNKSENLSDAESRIRDTDMATEMMHNAKLSILEQAVTSMMAQTNQSTQGVLSLLQ